MDPGSPIRDLHNLRKTCLGPCLMTPVPVNNVVEGPPIFYQTGTQVNPTVQKYQQTPVPFTDQLFIETDVTKYKSDTDAPNPLWPVIQTTVPYTTGNLVLPSGTMASTDPQVKTQHPGSNRVPAPCTGAEPAQGSRRIIPTEDHASACQSGATRPAPQASTSSYMRERAPTAPTATMPAQQSGPMHSVEVQTKVLPTVATPTLPGQAKNDELPWQHITEGNSQLTTTGYTHGATSSEMADTTVDADQLATVLMKKHVEQLADRGEIYTWTSQGFIDVRQSLLDLCGGDAEHMNKLQERRPCQGSTTDVLLSQTAPVSNPSSQENGNMLLSHEVFKGETQSFENDVEASLGQETQPQIVQLETRYHVTTEDVSDSSDNGLSVSPKTTPGRDDGIPGESQFGVTNSAVRQSDEDDDGGDSIGQTLPTPHGKSETHGEVITREETRTNDSTPHTQETTGGVTDREKQAKRRKQRGQQGRRIKRKTGGEDTEKRVPKLTIRTQFKHSLEPQEEGPSTSETPYTAELPDNPRTIQGHTLATNTEEGNELLSVLVVPHMVDDRPLQEALGLPNIEDPPLQGRCSQCGMDKTHLTEQTQIIIALCPPCRQKDADRQYHKFCKDCFENIGRGAIRAEAQNTIRYALICLDCRLQQTQARTDL